MSAYKTIYISNVCTEKKYRELFSESKALPGQQAQKYHRTLLKGFARNTAFNVIAISKLPISRKTSKRLMGKREVDEFGNKDIVYLPYINLPVVNNLVQFVSIKKEIRSLAKKGYRYCIIDVLNVSVNMAIISLCKRLNLKLIGIVTDIPKLISSDEKSMFVKATDFIIEKCDGYVLLTEQMNDFFNIDRKKPFAVIEGQIDDDVQTDQDEKHSPCEKKICMYAGSLEIVNGLKYMIEGFLKADISDLELYIYGNGGYREQIEQICAENRSIKYFGNRYVDEVVEAQKKADLLINPRPTDQEFVKYSFPSKNMEYMASGTPLLTTRLPGMPKEYDDHVYFIDVETAEGFADALRNVFSLSSDERRKKGLEAQEFVVENKKGSAQVEKIHAMFAKCGWEVDEK